MMKYLLVILSAVILATAALPTQLDHKAALNTTYSTRNIGFATFGGGTQGGQGGASWTVWDAWALRDALNSNDRRIVYVRGRIDLTVLFTGSPGVALTVGSYTTVIGGDGNAEIAGGGLSISNRQHVIVENLKLSNALSYAHGEQPNGAGGIISMVPGPFSQIDAIGISNSENVWVNHCELSDDPWVNSGLIPESGRRHDGLIDIVRGANWITISNCIIRNHNLVSLVGNSDSLTSDRDRLKVTWYHNWFMGTNQRNPRVRYGEVHILNNLFSDITDYGIGAGVEASIYAERNVFRNVRRSWVSAGTASQPGFIRDDNNLQINSAPDSGVPSDVRWHPSQYYSYNALDNWNVENSVRANAGVRR